MPNGYLVKYVIPILVWMAVIFISSSIPQAFFPEVGTWVWAKLVHVVYFGVLALFFQRALRGQTQWQGLLRHVQFASILLAVMYGATDELHQMFTPGRHARFTDVLIDGFGATLFILGSMVVRRLAENRVKEDNQRMERGK